MANILIVDDEAAIADLIQLTLAQAGHKSETAMSGSEAADKLEKEQYDLVLLDVMLPEISGFELMEYLAPTGTPVIFLTAKGALADRVRGLRLGADDYIVKGGGGAAAQRAAGHGAGVRAGSGPGGPHREAGRPADRAHAPGVRPVFAFGAQPWAGALPGCDL